MDILIRKKLSEFITPESLNFTELVRNSNTIFSLSNDYHSKMISILNEEFTKQEQQWYIANLYIFMHYHPTFDFPINLENVFPMIGFANKGNAMKTIKNNFTKDEDYKILIFPTEKRVYGKEKDEEVIFPTEKNPATKNLGGRPTENIMLNIDTFEN